MALLNNKNSLSYLLTHSIGDLLGLTVTPLVASTMLLDAERGQYSDARPFAGLPLPSC